MRPYRIERLGRELVRHIAQIVQQDLNDPRLGFVSITKVEVARDLSVAKVFVSVLGGPKEAHLSLEALRSAAGYIHRELRARVRGPEIPPLRFVRDDSIRKAFEVGRILDEIAQERGAREQGEDE
jgi:ribosome-binding factor A